MATVEGHFTRFAAILDDTGAAGTVDVASLQTRNEIRDRRLLSDEFFDVQRFPQMVLRAVAPLQSSFVSQLTIKDVTRPVVFNVRAAGRDGAAHTLLATSTISRTGFGLDWPALREAGRLIVSDRVQLQLELVFASA